jgi:hypothetical protein
LSHLGVLFRVLGTLIKHQRTKKVRHLHEVLGSDLNHHRKLIVNKAGKDLGKCQDLPKSSIQEGPWPLSKTPCELYSWMNLAIMDPWARSMNDLGKCQDLPKSLVEEGLRSLPRAPYELDLGVTLGAIIGRSHELPHQGPQLKDLWELTLRGSWGVNPRRPTPGWDAIARATSTSQKQTLRSWTFRRPLLKTSFELVGAITHLSFSPSSLELLEYMLFNYFRHRR